MRKSMLSKGTLLSGITIGGSGGGQPVHLLVLTILVVAMALVTVWHSATGGGSYGGRVKDVWFKCADCGHSEKVPIKKLIEMEEQRDPSQDPTMELIMQCPKCSKKAYRSAIECPECSEVFLMPMMDPNNPMPPEDKCPKCGVSYQEAIMKKFAAKQKK